MPYLCAVPSMNFGKVSWQHSIFSYMQNGLSSVNGGHLELHDQFQIYKRSRIGESWWNHAIWNKKQEKVYSKEKQRDMAESEIFSFCSLPGFS